MAVIRSALIFATAFPVVWGAPASIDELSKRATCSGSVGMVGYWGQNSAGITTNDKSKWEKPLASYCDGTYDVINLAFLNIFPSDVRNPSNFKPPTLNFAYHCEATFPDYPFLLNCPDIGKDVKTCQSKGVKVLLSIGGATGPYGFQSDDQARTFAQTFWDMFLGGSANGIPRPLGADVVLDGVDLDIEAGTSIGYAAFITRLRELFKGASKGYLISGAPQCVYPDAYLGPGGTTSLQTAWYDMLTIQFYNNYCEASRPSSFNFKQWADWAAKISLNPNVKVILGVPSASGAASSGYMTIDALKQTVSQLVSTNNFGGVMLWEVSLAELNVAGGVNYASAIKNHLTATCGSGSLFPSLGGSSNSGSGSASPGTSGNSANGGSSSSKSSASTYEMPVSMILSLEAIGCLALAALIGFAFWKYKTRGNKEQQPKQTAKSPATKAAPAKKVPEKATPAKKEATKKTQAKGAKK